MAATGARVRNTYATCPPQGDSPAKAGLIPRNPGEGILPRGKLWRWRLGMRMISQLAG